jgi:hypothetical protein
VKGWWDDPNYPRSVWTLEDRKAAERAGVVPDRKKVGRPIGQPPVVMSNHPCPSGFRLYGPTPTSREDERRAKVDAIVAGLGLRRRTLSHDEPRTIRRNFGEILRVR